jgi:hypothetical protein
MVLAPVFCPIVPSLHINPDLMTELSPNPCRAKVSLLANPEETPEYQNDFLRYLLKTLTIKKNITLILTT